MVIRLKVPIEMHYTVIPMGTSKVNSSRVLHLRCVLERVFLALTFVNIVNHNNAMVHYSSQMKPTWLSM